MFQYSTSIKKEYCDHYGHMNNAAYMQVFEEARWAFLESLDWGRSKVESEGYGPVLFEANILYKKELREGEKVSIDTQIFDADRRLFRIHQWLRNTDGETCAEAQFKLGLFSTSSRRLISPPQDWLRAIARIPLS